MKLWQKEFQNLDEIGKFTVGNDREMDMYLAPFDVIGSLAHIQMLESIGLLSIEELHLLRKELQGIYENIQSGAFKLEEEVEDIHSQVEFLLTSKLGDTGKKIHSGRSRNDQVLVDIKLFLRHEIKGIADEIIIFFKQLVELSEKYKHDLLPGYTHLQLAMPSSFGLWWGAYAESLVDDMIILQAAYRVTNKNPLGSGAGYGSSFPLNRTLTTNLLGFDSLNYNVVYAQMGRGKTERIVAQALSNFAATLSKLSMDVCLFMNQNFGFIGFADELTTGSSIMPHKKNPDVFELVRSQCNRLQSLPQEIILVTNNLPSGYHRDLQLLKEHLFPAFQTLKDCLHVVSLMFSGIHVRENILSEERYKYLFSVEEVNKLVLKGIPFRDAYKKIGMDIEKGEFFPSGDIEHSHEGSIGNLCNDKITLEMEQVYQEFGFERAESAIQLLLK